MQHSSSSEDGLLSVEVEIALKALGIASSDAGRSEGELRSAVEDLRRSEEAPPVSRQVRHARHLAIAPALLAADDDVVDL